MKLLKTIRIPEFLTHVAKTQNKVAADKYVKINNNTIYSGAINRFTRAKVVENLHNYISDYLDDIDLNKMIADEGLSHVHFRFTFKTVKNHGDIRRSAKTGSISWKKPPKNYVPRWDIENLASIWIKTFNDTLIVKGMMKDDSIDFLTGVTYEYQPCEDISEREIIVNIYGKD